MNWEEMKKEYEYHEREKLTFDSEQRYESLNRLEELEPEMKKFINEKINWTNYKGEILDIFKLYVSINVCNTENGMYDFTKGKA
jgi:hypothetical protein